MTVQQSTDREPRRSALDRDVAMRLAGSEYDRVVALLEQLTPEQWSAPTDCPVWDVRAMAGHVLGMAQMAASLPEMARQQIGSQRRATRDGGPWIDALTALQVEKNAHLGTAEIVDRMRRVGPKAQRFRRRTPGPVRNRTMPDKQDVGGSKETWTFGYLVDTILTRDPFMHRIDMARATGLPVHATADHEGVIVDDVVREWAGRHASPYALELTGPAGGHWRLGDGEHQTMDAFEFCRTLSGRAPGAGLLATQVPF
jgi:uncharacterized protein (TIGR03083 family)